MKKIQQSLRNEKSRSTLVHLFAGVALLSMLFSGCAKKQEVPAETSTTSTPSAVSSQSLQVVDSSSTGAIQGLVRFEGVAPAIKDLSVGGNPECATYHAGGKVKNEEVVLNGDKLQNVFVYVKAGLEKYRFDVPAETVEIDNKNCVYVPHVSGAQAGQAVVFLNGDPTLHNIHSYSKNNKAFNLGLPFQGMKQTKKFEPEVMINLKCDVHPWMVGYLGIVAHPYFAVSGADGEFQIKNLPAGEYTLEAWHEKFGVQSQTIRIEPQQTQSIEFKFTA